MVELILGLGTSQGSRSQETGSDQGPGSGEGATTAPPPLVVEGPPPEAPPESPAGDACASGPFSYDFDSRELVDTGILGYVSQTMFGSGWVRRCELTRVEKTLEGVDNACRATLRPQGSFFMGFRCFL